MSHRLLRRLFALAAGVSLVACVGAVVASAFNYQWVLRDGGGGLAGGSDIATYVLFVGQRGIGLGWTHSDVWFEGEIGLPLWLVAPLAAVLPTWWVIRRTRRSADRDRRGFEPILPGDGP